MRRAQATGKQGEELAAQFLESKGFSILARNYRAGREEIDLICSSPLAASVEAAEDKGGEIVFVEVKTRRGARFGSPEAAVDIKKQLAIRRVAESYLREHHPDGAPCRFDVVAVTLEKSRPRIEHFEAAFGYES